MSANWTYKYHDDDLYGWYEAGYDFIVARWNELVRNGEMLDGLPYIQNRLYWMKAEAWDRKVGNPSEL